MPPYNALGGAFQGLSQGLMLVQALKQAEEQRKRQEAQDARQVERDRMADLVAKAGLAAQGVRFGEMPTEGPTYQIPDLTGGAVATAPVGVETPAETAFQPIAEGAFLDVRQTPQAQSRAFQALRDAASQRQRREDVARAERIRAEDLARQAAQREEDRQFAIDTREDQQAHAQTMAEAAAQRATDAAAQQPSKPLTAQQAQAAGFARRMNITGRRIAEMEDKGLGLPTVGNEVWGSVPFVGGALQNKKRSPEQQAYQTLAENWVTANLRKESGAVIGKDEMAQEVRKYFPLATDHPETIKLKREMRRVAEENMWLMANSAPDPTASFAPDDQQRQYSPDNPYAPR